MKAEEKSPRSLFRKLGSVRWTRFDAFAVTTERGATLLLSPNSDIGVPTTVHIDEIAVPARYRRKGAATEAMAALCKIADKYNFRLDGGPIGWSESLWRDKFVDWMFRFGFERDLSGFLPVVDDPQAFYVLRLPASNPHESARPLLFQSR